MTKTIKRVIAYFIDILIITLITYLLSYTSITNPQLDKYNKYYDEYTTINEEYSNFNQDIKDDYEDKKITEEEYQDLIENNPKYKELINKYYIDNELNEENYKKLTQEIDNNYKEEYIDTYYKIEKYSTVHYAIYTIVIILYFTIFNLITKGQTLGKKLMKLKIVSTNDKTLNFITYLLRTIILYFPIYYIIKIIGVYYLNASNYYTLSTIFYEIQYYLKWIIILMIIIRKDGRGLHDLASHTKVIALDANGNEIVEENNAFNSNETITEKKEDTTEETDSKDKKKKAKKKVVVDTTVEEED